VWYVLLVVLLITKKLIISQIGRRYRLRTMVLSAKTKSCAAAEHYQLFVSLPCSDSRDLGSHCWSVPVGCWSVRHCRIFCSSDGDLAIRICIALLPCVQFESMYLLVSKETKAAAQKTSVSVEAAILCSFATSAHVSCVFLFAIFTDDNNQSSILDDGTVGGVIGVNRGGIGDRSRRRCGPRSRGRCATELWVA
jgi:hypothetical protein